MKIYGFPDPPSVFRGDGTLKLYVSGVEDDDTPRVGNTQFWIALYRQGDGVAPDPVPLPKSWQGWHTVDNRPFQAYFDDWRTTWNFIGDLEVPKEWASGVYLARFVSIDGWDGDPPNVAPSLVNFLDPHQRPPDARHGQCLFVVKRGLMEKPAPFLCLIPFFTYQAYNNTGDPAGSVYFPTDAKWGNTVGLYRPGAGTGGHSFEGPVRLGLPGNPWPDSRAIDYYNLDSWGPTFWHFEALFIRWFEGFLNSGPRGAAFDVDYCLDWDLHFGTVRFNPQILFIAGHQEYWSPQQRMAVDHYVQTGGKIAILSGNTSWRLVYLDKYADAVERTVQQGDGTRMWFATWWFWTYPNGPEVLGLDHDHVESSLTGVSYNNAGGWFYFTPGPRQKSEGLNEPPSYEIQNSDHWVFSDSNLREGDILGGYYPPPNDQIEAALVGAECDGAPILRTVAGTRNTIAYPLRFSPCVDLCVDRDQSPDPNRMIDHETPKDFLILGKCPLWQGVLPNPGWSDLPTPDGYSEAPNLPHVATMGIYATGYGGWVFNGSTTDWARVLSSGLEPRVEQITINLILGAEIGEVSIRAMGNPHPCGSGRVLPPTEGQTATFEISPYPGLTLDALDIFWQINDEQWVPGKTFKATMPAQDNVTVKVEVFRIQGQAPRPKGNKQGLVARGMKVFVPMTLAEETALIAALELDCGTQLPFPWAHGTPGNGQKHHPEVVRDLLLGPTFPKVARQAVESLRNMLTKAEFMLNWGTRFLDWDRQLALQPHDTLIGSPQREPDRPAVDPSIERPPATLIFLPQPGTTCAPECCAGAECVVGSTAENGGGVEGALESELSTTGGLAKGDRRVP